MERYVEALDHMEQMPQYSTVSNQPLLSRRQMAKSGMKPLALGTWSWLGPGNIGGRTRAYLIDPATPATMYASGVGGGIWKTTNSGASWAPLADLMANIAISSLAMDPASSSVIYAGTGEGYFNSDAIRGAGIFKTTNGGSTWAQLANTNTSDFYYVNRIIVSPNSSSRVYAATRTGIWRSLDSGATWTKVFATAAASGGTTDLRIRTDQANDVMIAADGNFAQSAIYRNLDAGGVGAWTQVFTEANMGRTSLAIAPSSQGTMYALSSELAATSYQYGLHAVFQSTDGGFTWAARVRNTDPTKRNTLLLTNPVIASLVECSLGALDSFYNQGWYDNVIAVDPTDPNTVWAGGIDLFRSTDSGANWFPASYWWFTPGVDAEYAHADQHSIVFHPQYNGTTNQKMYVGNDGGLFRTDNAKTGTLAINVCGAPGSFGLTPLAWTSLNNGYGVTQFYDGVPYPSGTTYFGGTQDNGTNRGTDGGGPNAWTSILGGDGGYVAVDPGNTNVLYAENTGLSIQKSTNGGSSWAPATTGIGSDSFLFISPFQMNPSNAQNLWTGGTKPWRTTNGATGWTQAGAAFAQRTSAIGIAPTDSNFVLFGRQDGFIHQTTTGTTSGSGTTWPSVRPTGVSAYVSWLAFDPTNKNIAYATYSTFGVPHAWKSTDAGASWASIDGSGLTGIPDIPAHSIVVDPVNTSRLYLGTDLGVFTSTDGGANWAVENSGFANVVTEALAVNGTTLFAFTHGRGAYRTAITTCTIPPTATVSGGGTIPVGGSATIQAALTGSPPWNVTWSDGPIQSGVLASPATRSVSPSVTTTYTVTAISDALCSSGTSSGSAAVTVIPPPSVTSISPNFGPTAGGTSVTIAGSNFQVGATVTFGGTSATVGTVTPTSIPATTPAHALGAVNVVVTNPDTQTGTLTNGFYYAPPSSATKFFPISPCRVLDTRNTNGPLGGPVLAAGAPRSFTVLTMPATCGIPSTARTITVNVAITAPTQQGELRIFPGNGVVPATSAISFRAGQTRSNNAHVLLATDGTGSFQVQNNSTGTVHFILDVNGYYQ